MNTPICPACRAKFSHSQAMGACSKCGLPDEIRDLGPRVIARWKRKSQPKSAADRQSQFVAKHPATTNKKHKPHGRP